MVQESFAGSQKDVVHTWLDLLGERTVSLYAEFHVGSVVAHHIDQSLWQFIAFLLVNPTFDGLYNFRVVEREYMVPAFTVATVAGEESLVKQSFKGHAEVVTL